MQNEFSPTHAIQEAPPVLFIARWVSSELRRVALTIGSDREACGMLGGAYKSGHSREATVIVRFPNLSKLTGSFAISVEEILKAEAGMRASGLQPVALFHTHRSGSARPSHRDTRLPWVTGLPSLIVAQRGGRVRLFCYDEIGGMLTELPVRAGNGETQPRRNHEFSALRLVLSP